MPSKILVVDDDPISCELIQEVLNSAEMEAHALTDSTQAAARLKEEKFDAVFLDVHMPSPDGIELARQIRTSGFNQSTPIVIITGEKEHAVQTRGFQAGANFLLFKPIDRQRLLRLIRATEGLIRQEMRRYQRVKVSCEVSMEWDQNQLKGITLDLSLNGMLVRASRVFPTNSLVEVSLNLKPRTPPLHAVARVVRISGDDCMGLQLEKVSAAEGQKLQAFLLPLILSAIDEKSRATPAR